MGFFRVVDHLAAYLQFLNDAIVPLDLKAYNDCYANDLSNGKVSLNGEITNDSSEIATNLARRKAALVDPDFGVSTFQKSLRNQKISSNFLSIVPNQEFRVEHFDEDESDYIKN